MRSPGLALAAALSLSAALPLVAATAAADLPPPIGYIEECTPERQQVAGLECVGCASYFGSPTKCPDLLVPLDFTKACQSRGASTWTEVWCRPATGAPLPESVSKQVTRPSSTELVASNVRRGAEIVGPLVGFGGLVFAGWRFQKRRRARRSVDAGRLNA
jgi:hypothetical protein